MSNYVKNNQPKKVMLVTECSMSDNVQVNNPNVQFIKPCNLCPYMKTISLPKVLECLEKETNEILIPEIIIFHHSPKKKCTPGRIRPSRAIGLKSIT